MSAADSNLNQPLDPKATGVRERYQPEFGEPEMRIGTPDALSFPLIMAEEGMPTGPTPSPARAVNDKTPKLPPGDAPDTFDSSQIVGLTCPETPNQSPHRFDEVMEHFKAIDEAQHIGHVPTVVFGSSTIANWTDLPQIMGDLGAINRGMGGSTLPDISNFVEDLVLKHTPDRVILYAGTNDIAEGHDGVKVAQDFEQLEHLIHGTNEGPKLAGASPDIKLYVIGMIPAPCREVLEDEFHLYDQGNDRIRAYTIVTPNTFYIDPSSAVDDQTGHLDQSRFGPDHLHPKPEVYTRLNSIIRREITAQEYPVP